MYAAGASDHAVVAMTREPLTGALAALACLRDVGAAGGGCGVANGLGSAHGVAVSPDNQNVYVTGQSDNALAVFKGPSAGPRALVPPRRPRRYRIRCAATPR